MGLISRDPGFLSVKATADHFHWGVVVTLMMWSQICLNTFYKRELKEQADTLVWCIEKQSTPEDMTNISTASENMFTSSGVSEIRRNAARQQQDCWLRSSYSN